MTENTTTYEDSTEEVHLPPNPPRKAKYSSHIKTSSKYRTVCTEPLLDDPFQAVKPLWKYMVISQIQVIQVYTNF